LKRRGVDCHAAKVTIVYVGFLESEDWRLFGGTQGACPLRSPSFLLGALGPLSGASDLGLFGLPDVGLLQTLNAIHGKTKHQD
jgi:hypothetical protein